MNGTKPSGPGWGTQSREWRILAPMGLLALAPYALFHGMFARLFWFGDEFDMVDQIDTNGFWHWTFAAYGENFVPVFKVLWGGSVLAFGGSYSAMMAVVWLAHAVNVVILGRLMRACQLPWAAVLLAQVVFGLTPATIETLAWSVQLSSMLSVTFLLLALDGFFRAPFRYSPISWAAASALAFARGLLTGPLLSFACLWPNGAARPVPLPRRAGFAALYAAPAVVVAVLMAVLMPSGNQGHMAGHWGDAAAFGAWYYCLNPAYHVLRVESWGPRTMVILGALKVALVAWSLARSRGRMQALFAVLAAFDLGSAVLLGIGRYQTGLIAAVSSRYQYAALVALLPAAGYLFARILDRVPAPGAIRGGAAAALLAVLACTLCWQWGADIDIFSADRGAGTRRVLLSQTDPDPFGVPGYPGFPTQRAKDLIARYHLH